MSYRPLRTPPNPVYRATPACEWQCGRCDILCAVLEVRARSCEQDLSALFDSIAQQPTPEQLEQIEHRASMLEKYRRTLADVRGTTPPPRGAKSAFAPTHVSAAPASTSFATVH